MPAAVADGATMPRRWTERDRRATIAVAVQFAVNGAFFASVLPRLPELRDDLEISTAAVGALLTASSVAGLASSATCTRLIARFGTRRVLAGGGVAISLALFALGVAPSWPIAALALAGMFAFDVYVDVAMNMQGSWLSARRHTPIMNRLHALWSLGAVAGGLVAGGLAAADVSPGVHLTVTAVVLALASTGIASQLLAVDETHADIDETAPSNPGRAARSERRGLGRFFVAGLTAVVIEIAAINWAAFRLTDDLDASGSAAALAYVAVVGGMTVTRLTGDHLAERLGPERFTTVSAIVAMVGLVAAALLDVPALAVISFLVAGLGIATLMPRMYDLAARAGDGTARGLGVLTAGMRVATIVTPVTIASVATRTSVGLAIAAVAVTAGLGFLAATRSPSTPG